MIRFHVPAVPVAQPRQRHRVVKIGGKNIVQNYTPKSDPVQDFKASVRQSFEAASKGLPPLGGPVTMRVLFILPRPKSLMWKSKPTPRLPHVTKPDVDNLVKACTDCLNQVAWRDDSQLVVLTASKFIASGSEKPHVEIEIAGLADESNGLADSNGVPQAQDPEKGSGQARDVRSVGP